VSQFRHIHFLSDSRVLASPRRRQYRRECLKRLKSNLNDELDYLDGFSRDNPKNYQIWHHRRTVVEWLGNGDRELDFCNEVFKVDAKNYHAWAHR
jgi:protein farnesyltransferase/geranylgeranyltransferase type-1 subunit alpha